MKAIRVLFFRKQFWDDSKTSSKDILKRLRIFPVQSTLCRHRNRTCYPFNLFSFIHVSERRNHIGEKKDANTASPSVKKAPQTKSVKKDEGKKGQKTRHPPLQQKRRKKKTFFFKGKEKKIRIEEKFSGRQYTLELETKKCHGTCSTV